MKYKVIAISDTHFPWTRSYYLTKIYQAIHKEKPDIIIHLGDLLDQYVFSKYSRDYNLITPKNEILKGLRKAESMWDSIHHYAPKAKKIQVLGNHDDRLKKRILERFPELLALDEMQAAAESLYEFEHVETLKSSRDYFEIDDVIYCHGWMSSKFAHAAHFGKSVVRGHSHKARLYSRQDYKTNSEFIFEMECGCLADEKQLPLCYTPSKFNKWKTAYGLIDKGIPQLRIL